MLQTDDEHNPRKNKGTVKENKVHVDKKQVLC
jgi:hypothetical protein